MEMAITLYKNWLEMKEIEKQAAADRRSIEDALLELLKVDVQSEKSTTMKAGGLKCSVTTRMSRKVDGDLLQEIAAENGVSKHLGTLFRWKPEINTKEWKAADSTITDFLLPAITTKPSRPTFKIELLK